MIQINLNLEDLNAGGLFDHYSTAILKIYQIISVRLPIVSQSDHLKPLPSISFYLN